MTAKTLTAPNANAHGLRCLGAKRTGQPHRASFVASATPGMVWVITDDCIGNTAVEMSTEDARSRYAQLVRNWDAIEADPTVTMVGTDRFGRFTYQ